MEIMSELDPVIEIVALLYISYHQEHFGDTVAEMLEERLGIDGRLFYSKHARDYEKYYKTFCKNRVVEEADRFFFEEDIEECSFITAVLLDKSLLEEEADEDRIRISLLNTYCMAYEIDVPVEEIKSPEDRIAFIQSLDLNESVKWKMLLFLQEPVPYLKSLRKVIGRNRTAFEKACAAVQPKLSRRLDAFRKSPEEFMKNYFIQERHEVGRVYPMFAMPFAQMLVLEDGYYGLLWDKMMEAASCEESSKELMAVRMKALGDKSKLEILLLLKEKKYYSQEIARQLNLTPATISYHMDVLSSVGFVTIEKQDKKIYYGLNRDTIIWLVEHLNQMFCAGDNK